MSAEESLKRLLELGLLINNSARRQEHRDLLVGLSSRLGVSLPAEDTSSSSASASTSASVSSPSSTSSGGNSRTNGLEKKDFATARSAFLNKTEEPPAAHKKPARAASTRFQSAIISPSSSPSGSPTSSGECDISSPDIITAYEEIRDDANSETNWMMLGYANSKKTLQLYGKGKGGVDEYKSNLKDDEVTYGYLRMVYGDSQRSKFVFVCFVPDTLSGLAKAKANMHKAAVSQFLKFIHVNVNATSISDLNESSIQSKLAAAAGANYGTGGNAAAGSEDFGSIHQGAKRFFNETEKQGNRQSIVYNKGPLTDGITPVSLQGRAGITEKYITQ